ncbi:MAG: hypothetical protein ACK57V_14905 [Pirellula sp.]
MPMEQQPNPFGIQGDSDFLGGSDSIVSETTIPKTGTYTISAKLLFQVIAPRHANELFLAKTAEVETFQKMFQKADRRPEELATATISVSKSE